MPTRAISGSTNLTTLGYRIRFNLVTGKILVDMSPSIWTGPGASNVQGARLVLVSPSGAVLSDGTTLVFTPNMDQVLSFDIPLFDNVYEYGVYQSRLTLVDDDSTEIAVESSFDLCAPYDLESNNGVIALRMDADCEGGTMKIYGGEGAAYKGVSGSSWTKAYTFYYPADSGQAPVPINVFPAELSLYTGMNKITGHSDGTFLFPNNYEVIVRFEGAAEKYVQCNFPCHLWCAMEDLVNEVANAECGTSSHTMAYDKLQQVNYYVPLVLLGIRCQKNVDKYIGILEEILGVENCPCGDEETVLMGAVQAAPITTTTTELPPLAKPVTTTTTAPIITTTTAPPVTSTTTEPCPEVEDIIMDFM